MKRLAVALLLTTAMPAWAMEAPAEGKADPRIRTLVYNPDQVVQLCSPPGASLTIQIADGEKPEAMPVSDQRLIDPDGEPARGAFAVSTTAAPAPTRTDPNLALDSRGNFIFIRAKKVLTAQPFMIVGKKTDADGHVQLRPYTFELSSCGRPDDGLVALTKDVADTYYLVRFRYPAEERAAAEAKRKAAAVQSYAAQTARTSRAARQKLAEPPPVVENLSYDGQGDRELAPARTWDDGQSTFLRFPGNMRVPVISVVDADGKEASVAYSATAEGLVTIHQTGRMFRLRDGKLVLCIINRAYDPIGRNPGTGTTRPDVVRELRQ